MPEQLEDVLDLDAATAPGDLPVAFIVNREQAKRNQFRHDNTILPLAPSPEKGVEVTAVAGEAVQIARASVYFTTDGSEPDGSSSRVEMSVSGTDWQVLSGYVTSWTATIPPQPNGTLVRYRIGGRLQESTAESADPDVWAQDGQGFWYRVPPQATVTTFAYHVEPAGTREPDWVQDAVIYQVFLDRFRNDNPDASFPAAGLNDIHGGTLNGVRAALPYISDLGVDCVWLSPLNPANTYHRYDGLDYYSVDPVLGTNDSLKQLTSEGASRGIRFLMDFVPSHCSARHPAFLAAQADPNAETASWFTFYEHPNNYRSFLDMIPFLPSLNVDDPGAREYVIGAAVQWLRDFGISGFRLDHAIGTSMDFWVAFRRATREVLPDSFTVGEATDSPDSLLRFRQRLDAILDFPLARAVRSTFGTGTWNVLDFDRFLSSYERFMSPGPDRVSFLDNHDMDRFLFIAGQDTNRLKQAALCQFALSPTPTIYYGTEIALLQERGQHEGGFGGDAEIRGDMVWDPNGWNQDVLQFYRRLIALRKSRDVLRAGTRRTLHVDRANNAYVFERRHESTNERPILAAFNLGHRDLVIDVPGGNSGVDTCLVSTGEASIERSTSTATVKLKAGAAALFGQRDA
jgi:glycosidase